MTFIYLFFLNQMKHYRLNIYNQKTPNLCALGDYILFLAPPSFSMFPSCHELDSFPPPCAFSMFGLTSGLVQWIHLIMLGSMSSALCRTGFCYRHLHQVSSWSPWVPGQHILTLSVSGPGSGLNSDNPLG